jgi:hypothetical protein
MRSSPLLRSWLATAAARWTRTATISGVTFQWAADNSLAVLAGDPAPHRVVPKLDGGPGTGGVDDRPPPLSTVCGFYRFAHIDGRIASNPAQYVRRPQVHPSTGRGLDRSELGVFLFTAEENDRAHAALAVLLGLNGLRVSEACATNIEDLAIERGHRTLRILGNATSPPPSRSSHGRYEPSTWPSANGAKARSCAVRTANGSIDAPPIAGFGPSASGPGRTACGPARRPEDNGDL